MNGQPQGIAVPAHLMGGGPPKFGAPIVIAPKHSDFDQGEIEKALEEQKAGRPTVVTYNPHAGNFVLLFPGNAIAVNAGAPAGGGLTEDRVREIVIKTLQKMGIVGLLAKPPSVSAGSDT